MAAVTPENPTDTPSPAEAHIRQVAYWPAVACGTVIAMLVVLVLANVPPDTDCYRAAVDIEVATTTDLLDDSCDSDVFRAVNNAISDDRAALRADPTFEVDQPDSTAGRSAQVVWFGLIAILIGLAWATARLA